MTDVLDQNRCALVIASVMYGGVEPGSVEWDKALAAAKALGAPEVSPLFSAEPPYQRPPSFDLCKEFNARYPMGTSGTLDLGNGQRAATRVEQNAMVFPH